MLTFIQSVRAARKIRMFWGESGRQWYRATWEKEAQKEEKVKN